MNRAPALHEVIATEPRLYRVLASRIEDLIREQGIEPGERLPSERDLANKLGVSRTSLREALIALELGGIVEVRGGSGVYVSERAAARADGAAAGPGPFEVLAARRMIEAEVAAMAAKNATDGAIDAILAALEHMEALDETDHGTESADRNFHLAIARACGNSAMAGVIDYLLAQRGSTGHKPKECLQSEELRRQSLLEHRAIAAAIAAHDVAAARQAMRAHLDRAARAFARG